jgi:hypothetical protein
MISAVDVMDQILKFKGFWRASFKDKLVWLFILYPFMIGVILLYLSGNIVYAITYKLKRLIRKIK